MSGISGDRPPPTAEQLQALGVSGASVALSAGAGTGKTFVLAERFVRALEDPEARSLGRVVALTFTNKAARELRQRIRRVCRDRLDRGQDPGRWRAVLRGLEAARIGTFHSFCGDVLRRHAIEAGVDPGFTVLDESIALSIRQDALAKSLRDALTRRDPDLIDLAVDYGLGMVRQSIDSLLANRSAGDILAWTEKSPRDLVDSWVGIWNGKTRPALMKEFRQTLDPCLALIDVNAFDNPKVRARLDELRDAAGSLDLPGDPIPAIERVALAARVVGLASRNWPSTEVYEAFKGQFEAIREAAKDLKKILPWDEPATMAAAEQGLKFARLTVKGREAYDLAKRERGGIDHDDLLLLTRDLLRNPDAVAREDLASSVDLVLVDEFQDTDPVQAEILECLAGPSLLDGKLFLVGDVKQSIYRFRGAKPDLFSNYRKDFPAEGRLELSTNFRSVPAILAFVNALFAETFDEANAALRPGVGPPQDSEETPPAIEFLWDTSERDEGAKSDVNLRRRDEARRIARHLKTRLEAGWMILDPASKQLRAASQGDVAFLFRSLSDSSDYEQALAAEGLDYHVVGGSGFYAQQEVLDLINVLTSVEDPLDAVSLAGALRSPFFSMSDDALFWISSEKIGQPHEGLERCSGPFLEKLPKVDRPRAERARTLLGRWRSVKDLLPIAGLLERILTESGYEAALISEFLGDRKRANARKLVRMARQFDEQGGFTLADFVARLRADLRGATKETQAATTDEDGQIIRLMSIHQAKGLEFPIVVLPDLDRRRPGELKRVAFDPDLGPLVNPVLDSSSGEDGEIADAGGCLGWTIYRKDERTADDAEALRLFYVAVTRARDALVISSAADPTGRPASPAMRLLGQRFDRSTGRFLGSLPAGWPEPRVLVVEPVKNSAAAPSFSLRQRPPMLEVARAIEQGLGRTSKAEVVSRGRPRLFDLDPAFGLSSTSARLDRLIRTILADSRSLDPKQFETIAAHAARLQDPVSPRSLVERAIERFSGFSRSPAGRDLARATILRQSFEWMVAWPEFERATVLRGRGDFVFQGQNGTIGLANLSDPDASEDRERLRILLSAIAAGRMGLGTIGQAWWIRLGSKEGPILLDRFDRAAVDQAMERVFARPS